MTRSPHAMRSSIRPVIRGYVLDLVATLVAYQLELVAVLQREAASGGDPRDAWLASTRDRVRARGRARLRTEARLGAGTITRVRKLPMRPRGDERRKWSHRGRT